MEENIGLFKILVVVLVVGYQIVKALQKKAAGTALPGPAPENPAPDEEVAPEETSPWGQEPPKRQAETESMRERLRALVLGRMEPPPPPPVAPVAVRPEPPPALEAPIAPLSRSRTNNAIPVPALRDLLVSQVVLGPPRGLRGIRPVRPSPVDLRP